MAGSAVSSLTSVGFALWNLKTATGLNESTIEGEELCTAPRCSSRAPQIDAGLKHAADSLKAEMEKLDSLAGRSDSLVAKSQK